MRILALVLLACLLVGLIEGRIRPTRDNVKTARHSVLKSGGPFCQNVVAYYEGTFKNQQNPNLNYTVQFQLQLNASLSDQQIYVVFNRWNNTLLSNNAFSFDFAYDDKDIIGDQIGAPYSGPFASNPTDFFLTLDHDTADQKWDNSVHIMYFSAFNNSFQLENAIGQCTRRQLQLTSIWNMNPDLVNYCVCCGDYLPSEQLGCPVNPWAGPVQQTTSSPRETTTTPLPQPTTSPPLASVSCQSIVTYYDGTFKNEENPDRVYSAQFQFRLTSDLATQRYELTVEGWNETVSDSNNFSMDLWYISDYQLCNDLTVNNTCSSPFGEDDYDLWLDLDHGSALDSDNDFHLFGFNPFDDHIFTFDAIGKCTANPPTFDDGYTPDPALYKVCMCCDDYKPHSSLNCPKSPWASN